jgi:hypothetical protein
MAILTKTTDKGASCALIGYRNKLGGSTTNDALVMLIPNTYERYTPSSSPTTVKFQLTTPSPVDFVAIGAHNAGTHDGGTDILISYATTVGGALTDIANMQFTDNKARMITFDSVTVAEIAITFDTATTGLELGVIYAGEALRMEQPIYGGHSPQALGAETNYQSPLSDTGQFLGRNITSEGTRTQYQWQNLTPSFVYGEFASFIDTSKESPFFIKWRPDLYEDTSFCHTTNDIKPKNMGSGHQRMSVAIDVRGHA